MGAVGRREPGHQAGTVKDQRLGVWGPRKGWASYFCHPVPPTCPGAVAGGVSHFSSSAERRPPRSSNMICNFRQTFEVPDICIMWASLLATGNSCLAFPRLNCNYTRSLPGGGGRGEGVNTASWHFQTHLAFIHFLPPVKRPGIQPGPGCCCPCFRGCCCDRRWLFTQICLLAGGEGRRDSASLFVCIVFIFCRCSDPGTQCGRHIV